jgi:hypothetical protein
LGSISQAQTPSLPSENILAVHRLSLTLKAGLIVHTQV